MPSTTGSGKPHRYSFSGSDARAYAYYPGAEDQMAFLESMQTISISVHEGKGPARSFGYRSEKGFARGMRTIAGSMILTVIEDHPLRDLVGTIGGLMAREPGGWGGWSVDRQLMGTGTALNLFDMNNRLATLLPPFNLFVSFVSEGAQTSDRKLYTNDIRYGEKDTSPNIAPDGTSFEQNLLGTVVDIPGASYLVEGIEIVDSGIVTSVHDVISEVTLSFRARNFRPLSAITFSPETHNPIPADEQRESSLLNRMFNRRSPEDKLVKQYETSQDKSRRELIKLGRELGIPDEDVQAQLIAAGLGEY